MTGWGDAPSDASITQVKDVEVDKEVAVEKPTHLEAIMMFGKPKVGKTMAACSVIDEALKSSPKAFVHYVCTDNGFDLTFQAYFKDKSEEIRRRMHVYPAYAFKKNIEIPLFTQVATMFFDIKKAIKKEDQATTWLIVDLADNFYAWSMDEWMNQSSPKNDTTTYMKDAAADLKKYVEFNHNQWTFIKRLDNIATNNILESPPCNLLYIFGEKTMEMGDDPPKDKEKEASDAFELVGCKPGGQKNLPYTFSTIVYISGLKQKKFTVLGDRGYFLSYEEKPYDKLWYRAFLEERKSQMK